MSEFDKEAEREKLREQFADDERERESTQRMSELLLQGATMTNKHCDVHGAPLFRQNGEEFCPTCQTEGRETVAAENAEQAADAEATAPTEQSPSERPPSEPSPVEQPTEQSPAPDRPAPAQSSSSTATTDGHEATPTPERTAAPEPRGQSTHPAHTDLSEARASLARTVTRFADEAERTDDLARAREYLDAVEDAADALAAVRNAEK
ncbi:Sjogren's syndrome/scleroderma autoantigen 1 family protein [Halomarina rubra]|uniref:Sjogren's syndrome/scleroderma autoantigen 1 family protein n=1 Tax=Halomarina rubra TaxID=2071873 RepID=A0ABD6AUC4_9EURY|nr:Sjogren's syndrome/scleroderma autoantigen 1 family protein [Halomarina rubra]